MVDYSVSNAALKQQPGKGEPKPRNSRLRLVHAKACTKWRQKCERKTS